LACDGTIVAEMSRAADRSHVASLPGLVKQVLAAAAVELDTLDGVAVSIGPGSFTGLRIGLALAKGLAYAGGVPLVPVPTLEALAWAAGGEPGASVCAAIDARKGEIYAARFAIATDGAPLRQTPDRAWDAHELAASLPAGTIVVGDADAEYGALFGSGLRVRASAEHPPRGGIVARLGAALLAGGHRWPIETLEPAYLRPADATLPEKPLR